jgi:hypothetical protein
LRCAAAVRVIAGQDVGETTDVDAQLVERAYWTAVVRHADVLRQGRIEPVRGRRPNQSLTKPNSSQARPHHRDREDRGLPAAYFANVNWLTSK